MPRCYSITVSTGRTTWLALTQNEWEEERAVAKRATTIFDMCGRLNRFPGSL